MYIEQLRTKNFTFLLYVPVFLGFAVLMGANYFMAQDMSTEDLIHSMISQFGTNITFIIMVGPLSAMCLGLLFWVKVIHRQSIRSLTTSRKKVDWGRIFFSFGLWSVITILLTSVAYIAAPENFVVNFEAGPFFTFLILAVFLIPLQTCFEEFFFRGYLMQGVGVITNSRLIPFLTSSLLFGLLHIANPEVGKLGYAIMAYYVGTGFFLGIMTLMDEGLELALGFHAANNLVGALLVTSDWTAFQTHSILKDVSEPTAGFEIMLPIFVLFPILLYVFSKKYGWTNWKERLTGKLQA